MGWADFTAPDLPAEVDRLRAAPGGHRLVGLRHQLQVEPDTPWLADTHVRTGLGQLADRALVFDVVVSPHQLPLVIETVRAVPATRFVLNHAGKPAVACFGPDRVMTGSDWPVCLLAADYAACRPRSPARSLGSTPMPARQFSEARSAVGTSGRRGEEHAGRTET